MVVDLAQSKKFNDYWRATWQHIICMRFDSSGGSDQVISMGDRLRGDVVVDDDDDAIEEFLGEENSKSNDDHQRHFDAGAATPVIFDSPVHI